jgi:hypothetical protein
MSAVSLLLLYYAYAWAALSMQQFLWSEVHIQFTIDHTARFTGHLLLLDFYFSFAWYLVKPGSTEPAPEVIIILRTKGNEPSPPC